MNIRFF
jgi:hypothetical protein